MVMLYVLKVYIPLTELSNTDYGLLLRRRGPLQPIRIENA